MCQKQARAYSPFISRFDDCGQDQSSANDNGGFWNENDLPTSLYNIGELLNVSFDLQDLFMQVVIHVDLLCLRSRDEMAKADVDADAAKP
jgi:hypothetical protein